MHFVDQIISAFENYPQNNAFCIQDTYYSYKDLQQRVAAVQHQLVSGGKNVSLVGIIIRDDIETYASIVAVLLLGKAYLPVSPAYPAERIASIISQSGVQVILSATPFPLPGNVNSLLTASPGNEIVPLSVHIPLEDNPAYLLFTSGSTGTPKGVPISYGSLNAFVAAFFDLGYVIDDRDRFLQMFDLTFDLSVMSYLVPLCVGACVYTVSETGTKYTNIYSILDEHHITFALMVPSILLFLRPYFDEISLPHLRYSLFCGEALHADVVAGWMRCAPHAQLDNVYGPTEATIFCMRYSLSREQKIDAYNGIVSIGTPMSGVNVLVVSESQHVVADGVKGELCLSGAQVTNSYLNPANNSAAFFERSGEKYYRTGDIVFKDEQGNYLYCGRADQQVKVQGFRVELGEIEFHLKSIASGNAVVFAVTNSNDIADIEAVFEGKERDITDILQQLKTILPHYMIPVKIHFVEIFPLNTNGKTDRNELRKMITASI